MSLSTPILNYTYPTANQTCFGGGDNFVFSGKNTHFFDKICIIFLIIDDSQFWTINGRNLQI